MSPLVSVVLLTYNHARYIREAIESVLMQQAPFQFELIVTDDHSTDGTWDIVQHYATVCPHVIAMRSHVNLNSNSVTSRAIAVAKGEFIAFLDGDDFWTNPSKLARQAAFLQGDMACSICCHDALLIDADGNRSGAAFSDLNPAPLVGDVRSFTDTNYIPGPSPMIRRAALNPLPAWFEDVEFGDWAIYLAALRHGHVGYLRETMAAYRVHATGYWSGLSSRDQHERILRFQTVLADRGPEAWRAEFRAAHARREAKWQASQAQPPATPRTVRLDLAELKLGENILVEPGEAVELEVHWNTIWVGTLPIPASEISRSASDVIGELGRSALSWKALGILFERCVYHRLHFTEDEVGHTAWLDGEMLADGLPPCGPARIEALHERIGWLLLEREVRPTTNGKRLLLAPLWNRNTGDRLTIGLELSGPIPSLLTNCRQLTVRLSLGQVVVKELILTRSGMLISASEIAEHCNGLGYALAEASFLHGVVGYAVDDPLPLRARLQRAAALN